MNRKLLLAVAGLTALAGSASAAEPKHHWLGSLDEALRLAQKDDKPIFLVFR